MVAQNTAPVIQATMSTPLMFDATGWAFTLLRHLLDSCSYTHLRLDSGHQRREYLYSMRK